MPKAAEETVASTLEKIFRLIAVLATRGLKRKEQIALLHQAGLQPKEIAEVLGTTRNTVNVTLAGIRKSEGKKRGRRKIEN